MLFFIVSPVANAYPQSQLNECILGSKQSPIILGVPAKSIENYCDCVLTLIVDKGSDAKESAKSCGLEYF
mgnify:CR=1 FL=1